MKVFIVKNKEGLTEFGHPIADLCVVAESESDADSILNGCSGSRAWNILRDRALSRGYDLVRPMN